MSASESKGGLQVVPGTEAVIPIGTVQSLDLSSLSETERNVMLDQYRRGLLDVSRKAQEMQVDMAALRATLEMLNSTARAANDSGNSVTVTHTQSSTIGRTEVIIGNTKAAERGRLTSSQSDTFNWTPIVVAAGVIAAIFILISVVQ